MHQIEATATDWLNVSACDFNTGDIMLVTTTVYIFGKMLHNLNMLNFALRIPRRHQEMSSTIYTFCRHH